MPVYDDVPEGVFDYPFHGTCEFCSKFSWKPHKRNDIIVWDTTCYSKELEKDIRIAFYDECSHRPIIGYEFAINTGEHTPVCCKKQSYSHHESKIIMKNIAKLLLNKWARK